MRCANITACLAVVLADFGSNAMLDFYGPNFRRAHLDHQIDFCSGSCSVKIGFCATGQSRKNIFNDEALPAFIQSRI